MELCSDEVIVTGLVPYGESDLVVRLFARERGRIGAFARGARRSKRRFAGALQVLATGTASLKARRGSELFQLESLEPDPGLLALARDPEAWGRASYLVEIVEKLLPEAEPSPALFRWLREAFALLAEGRGDARLLRAFELKLLGETGYLPDLSTSSDVPGRPPVAVDPVSGELVALSGPGRVPFPPEAQRAAEALLVADLATPPDVDDETLKAVGRLFAVHLRRMGITELNSVAFLKNLGAPASRS